MDQNSQHNTSKMSKKIIASATLIVEQYDDGSITTNMTFSPGNPGDFDLSIKSHRQVVNAAARIYRLNNPEPDFGGAVH